jgi:hypothetical protein
MTRGEFNPPAEEAEEAEEVHQAALELSNIGAVLMGRVEEAAVRVIYRRAQASQVVACTTT